MTNENHIQTLDLIFRIWTNLSKKRKKQLFFISFTMLASAFAEMLSLASVIPFLSVISNPERLFENTLFRKILNSLNIYSVNNLIIFATLSFVVTIFFAALIRLGNLYFNNFLAAKVGSDFGCEAYQRTLYQPYQVHIKRNSSVVMTAIIANTDRTVETINFLLMMFTSLIVSFGILTALVILDWQVALSAGLVFTTSYLLLSLTVKKRLINNSKIMAIAKNGQVKALQEGLGAIRDVLLDNSQKIYLSIYKKSDVPFWEKQAQSQFLAVFPRYAFEALGLTFIALVALLLTIQNGTDNNLIPLLGAFALGAQRLLPSMQNVYTAWARTRFLSNMVSDLLDILEQPIYNRSYFKVTKPLGLKKQINLKNIRFRYEGEKQKLILDNVSFSIQKGDRIGIIGTTGAGKSTLIDIIMGLLKPLSGEVEVDNKDINSNKKNLTANWQASLAHVPQSIFLADASIIKNIAFGLKDKEINLNRVKDAAKQANISDYIESLPKKYNTNVGERGIQLSGGQRQRIGIARALYKKSKVLILDEATSSLDTKTESSVMQAIDNLNDEITIIIITHRFSTIANCNKIIKLENGKLVNS